MILFLKLVRYKNLLIIAATQYMMRYLIVKPILDLYGFRLQLDEVRFFLLVFSSISITAAGYVINDYFDTKTDMLNRPKTVMVGRKISRKAALLIHIILNAIGILTGIYLSYHIGVFSFGIAYLLAAGILWFYSTTYKRQLFIGNFIVAVFTAMVPFVVVIFEVPLLIDQYREVLLANDMNFNILFGWVGGFAFFAFLTTLLREIIKDVEDFEGDAAFGRDTVPVVLGIKTAKGISLFLILLAIFSLAIVYRRYLSNDPAGQPDLISLIYFGLGLVIPFILLMVIIIRARDKKDYHRASNLTKLIMLSGILYSVVVWHILSHIFT